MGADAEPEAEPEADAEAAADAWYGYYGYPGYYGYGYRGYYGLGGYYGGYYGHPYHAYGYRYFGKRSADAEPEAEASPEAYYGRYYGGYYGYPYWGYAIKYLPISCHFYIPLWSFRTNNTALSNTEIFIFLKNCYETTHIWTKIKIFDKGIRATSSVQLSVFDIQLLTIVILSETVKPK